MPHWDQRSLHTHWHVYSSDNQDLGTIAHIYEDSFKIEQGLIFHKDRYIPYSAIASVDSDNDRVQLTMSGEEVTKNPEWEKRPDYENHLSDPLQLMYDRGHGIHDPFDETNPDKA
jgi:hypothetical protein